MDYDARKRKSEQDKERLEAWLMLMLLTAVLYFTTKGMHP